MNRVRHCFLCNIIGIKHVFSCINVCQVPREVLKTEAKGRGFQQLLRDLARVNVLENNFYRCYCIISKKCSVKFARQCGTIFC